MYQQLYSRQSVREQSLSARSLSVFSSTDGSPHGVARGGLYSQLIDIFLCFAELLAGVPRGAQNFGYVSMEDDVLLHTHTRLAGYLSSVNFNTQMS